VKRGAKESDFVVWKESKGCQHKGGKPSRWESGRFLIAVIFVCDAPYDSYWNFFRENNSYWNKLKFQWLYRFICCVVILDRFRFDFAFIDLIYYSLKKWFRLCA
jgi:hypothetical protein